MEDKTARDRLGCCQRGTINFRTHRDDSGPALRWLAGQQDRAGPACRVVLAGFPLDHRDHDWTSDGGVDLFSCAECEATLSGNSARSGARCCMLDRPLLFVWLLFSSLRYL